MEVVVMERNGSTKRTYTKYISTESTQMWRAAFSRLTALSSAAGRAGAPPGGDRCPRLRSRTPGATACAGNNNTAPKF